MDAAAGAAWRLSRCRGLRGRSIRIKAAATTRPEENLPVG